MVLATENVGEQMLLASEEGLVGEFPFVWVDFSEALVGDEIIGVR